MSDIVEWLRSRYLRELNGGREEEAAVEITRLRAGLEAAERERDNWRGKYWKLGTDRGREAGGLYKAYDREKFRAKRAEADLAEARPLIEDVMLILELKYGKEAAPTSWLGKARAFLERTARPKQTGGGNEQ